MRYNGSCTYISTHNSDENEVEHKDAMSKKKKKKRKTLSAKMPGMRTWTSVAPGRQHTTERRQPLHPTSVTDSVWTVRLDADFHERRLEWG